MSPREHADEHLDLEVLAELAEGSLEASRAVAARAHLAACGSCQRATAEITEVRRLLAAAPPATMPPDVADRIDAALATAAPQRLDRAGSAHPTETTETTGTTRPARRARHVRGMRWAAAAAAVVVLVVGGVATARALLDGPEFGTTTTGGAPAEGAGGDASAGAGVAPQRADGGTRVVATGTRYAPGSLPDQATRLVRRPATGLDDTGEIPAALRPLADPDRLRGCVARATGSTDRGDGAGADRAVVVDLAYFQGVPAALIVRSGPAGDRLELWAVGRDCSADRADLLRHSTVRTG